MANDQYGFWISHKGELIPVDKFKHYDMADQYVVKHHYKEFFDYVTQEDDDRFDPPSSTTFLFNRLGWIRIVQEGRVLNAEIAPNTLSLPAYRAFVKFVNDNVFEYYNVDIKGEHGHLKGYNYSEDVQGKRYKDKLFAMMKSNVNTSMVMSSDEPYGYWITDKGELLKVPTDDIGHIGIFNKYARTNQLKVPKSDWEDVHDSDYSYLLNLGWIRIAFERYDDMNIEVGKNTVSLLAYKKLVILMKGLKKSSFYVDISILGRVGGDKNDTNSKQSVLSLVERNVKQGGSMTTANYVREKVHASVLANAAKDRLDLYKRLKNEKKI